MLRDFFRINNKTAVTSSSLPDKTSTTVSNDASSDVYVQSTIDTSTVNMTWEYVTVQDAISSTTPLSEPEYTDRSKSWMAAPVIIVIIVIAVIIAIIVIAVIVICFIKRKPTQPPGRYSFNSKSIIWCNIHDQIRNGLVNDTNNQ